MIWRIVILCGAVSLLVFLGLYNQPYYPASWQDEGFVLQGAMNLVKHGKYAMQSSEGFRLLDQPLIANGPGVVLPITAMFSIFGIGLLQARLVILGFMLYAVVMFYLVSERMTGRTAAVISKITLLGATSEGFLHYGRMALGNIPALAYLLTGFLFVLNWNRSQKLVYAFLAGLFFGLAVVTKSQTALIIPALVISAVLHKFYYKKSGFMGYLIMNAVVIGCFGIWYLAQFLIVGQDNFSQHLAAIQSSSRVTILVLRPERIPRNIYQFMISGMPVYFIPGLLWLLWQLIHKKQDNISSLPVVSLIVTWLAWFVLLSIGWHRYFFEPAVIGILFSGKLVVDILKSLKIRRQNNQSLPLGHIIMLVFTGVFGLVVVLGLAENIRRIIAPPDTSLQRFAEYLNQNIPSGVVVESWEWEIDPLVDLNFHHPTNEWVDKMTLKLTFGESQDSYSLPIQNPHYLIEGPFSAATGIYSEALLSKDYKLVHSVHPYYLYHLTK
jgi:4-amino-4-deoxy-L-arabinose transferase-like glycosyltransferase